jgi:hypothetical protein
VKEGERERKKEKNYSEREIGRKTENIREKKKY